MSSHRSPKPHAERDGYQTEPLPTGVVILIVVALLLVLRVLAYLVRLVAFPKRGSWLRQYREAYERFLCPVCEYPIRRGPLKYLFWTRRTVKRLPQPAFATPGDDETYTCPMCTTRLYEECPACQAQRHALLPACQHCGAVKPLDEMLSAANGRVIAQSPEGT